MFKTKLAFGALLAALVGNIYLAPGILRAQNPNYPGYLGVYVEENDGGMQIIGFILRTPAARLAALGELNRYDTIVKLAGHRTQSLAELRWARNTIPFGKEGKMVLRTPSDSFYFVWISRNRPGVYGAVAPDEIRPGGVGPGTREPDIRDIEPDGIGSGPDIRDR